MALTVLFWLAALYCLGVAVALWCFRNLEDRVRMAFCWPKMIYWYFRGVV